MNTENDTKFDLDLHFLPAWAQQPSVDNRYSEFETSEDEKKNKDRSKEGRRGGFKRQKDERRRSDNLDRSDQQNKRGRSRRRDHKPQLPKEEFPEVDVTILPEERGVDAIAKQIRITGRAYPLFEIGYLVLKKPERFVVKFSTVKKPDGQIACPLYVCSLDDSLWFSEGEAIDYILDKHFNTFYQAEKAPAEPPKGVFTFVAQCGLSGIILGPPNYHDYQNKLRKLHAEKFSYMPFETYKTKVRIVKDPEVVKKWIEEQSFKTEYICLNVPEAKRLFSREEVERHFREVHLANVLHQVDSMTISGVDIKSQPSKTVRSLFRVVFEEQKRFPLKVVNALSQQFSKHGLQFFKVNKSITHVCIARPKYLDLSTTPVSENVRRIINYINEHPGITLKKLIEGLAPNAAISQQQDAPALAASAGQSDQSNATLQSDQQQTQTVQGDQTSSALDITINNPEVAAIVGDLHWLIREGHVIEFANGALEVSKQPKSKQQQKEKAAQTESKQESPHEAQQASQINQDSKGANAVAAASQLQQVTPNDSDTSKSDESTDYANTKQDESTPKDVLTTTHADEQSSKNKQV